jgi:hypothetical protein
LLGRAYARNAGGHAVEHAVKLSGVVVQGFNLRQQLRSIGRLIRSRCSLRAALSVAL